MAPMERISDETLEQVIGGVKRTVDTHTEQNAALRSGPGISYPQIHSLKNGSFVLTTGKAVKNSDDGRTWYEIFEPVHGWIAGSLIGF